MEPGLELREGPKLPVAVKAEDLSAGAIGLIAFPNNDGSADEVRPVVVLGIGPLGGREDEVVLIAEVTADEERVKAPLHGDLLVEEWDKDSCSLDWPSVIRCRQIRSLAPSLIHVVIGHVEPPTLIAAQRFARELFPL